MTEREFSAGGIVIRKKTKGLVVLLIKDSYGRWTWPKGNINKSESSKGAACREIEEEVGIKDVRILKRVGKSEYFYKREGLLRFKTVYIYLCETGQAKLKIQKEEIESGKWFAPQEAFDKVEYKGAKELLRKAVKIYAKCG